MATNRISEWLANELYTPTPSDDAKSVDYAVKLDRLVKAAREMVAAMRRYEDAADCDAPAEHRAMMDRITAALRDIELKDEDKK